MPVKFSELQNNSRSCTNHSPQQGLKVAWEITSCISAGSKGAVV